MNIKQKAYMYIAITVVTGALIPILVEAANSTNMFGFFMLTAFVSTATGVAFLIATKSLDRLIGIVRNPRSLALSVLMGLLIFLPIEFGIAYAEKFVSVSLATVLFRTSPLLMLPLLPLMLREKLTRYQIAALLLAFIGIYIGATGGTLTGIFVDADLFAVGFLIMLALLYAVSTVMVKKYMVDMGSLLTIAAATLSLLFVVLYFADGGGAINLNTTVLVSILTLGIGSNFIFYYMYFAGLRILKTTFVTNFISLSPFLTFIFADVLLGEKILPYYVTIALFVGAGILIQHFDKIGGTYLTKKKYRGSSRFTIFDVSGAFVNTAEHTISTAMMKGGRVLALRVDEIHANKIEELAKGGSYPAVFTDRHGSIAAEADFVREVLGAGKNDIVVMKAGLVEENEKFFTELSNILDASEDRNSQLGTK